jgi:hypothetical protein
MLSHRVIGRHFAMSAACPVYHRKRQMADDFRRLGYDAIFFHTELNRHDADLPYRRGVTVLRKYRILGIYSHPASSRRDPVGLGRLALIVGVTTIHRWTKTDKRPPMCGGLLSLTLGAAFAFILSGVALSVRCFVIGQEPLVAVDIRLVCLCMQPTAISTG